MLNVLSVSGGYTGASVIKNVSFELEKGELFGILGPNGSGKTTLLKMLSGILPFSSGEIVLKGKSLKDYPPKELAKIIAVLPQHSMQSFSYTVKETVSLGRYAHQKGWFHSWSQEDERVVRQAMEQTGVDHFADHYIHELSGGERQRVFLAQALAQEPEILLLDEPTNHLDLSFQKDLLDLLKDWTKNRGLTVISIFHDLNLAGLYCDRLLLLENGVININDSPNEVLREDRIRKVYNTKIEKQPHPKVPAPQMVLLPEELTGEREACYLDERFLELSGEHIVFRSPIPLRTMSSGVIGSGTGWHQLFVNRHVDKDYDCSDHRKEMADYLKIHGFEPGETVGMMTAVMLEDVKYQVYDEEGFSVFIIVTAGVGNAIDASRGSEHVFQMQPGTINTWIFVSGDMTEEAIIQSIMTATEAKVKAMHDLEVRDAVTGTLATGTSTDSILIASTQRGRKLEYAGTITPLGKIIGKGVYECTREAIQKSRRRVKK
ncbi:adenosylcobinamide amidohydrolase [Bacillus sp. S/N-304-OC-R1]|uniref:adenosylcobinamide amidohydrolase n=1 Tax=Bacillus sp. S/N-304-OC-R1 TaxID=2758034 RepID=UPI001C8D8D4E|nr:adenosylcobinamide amidohydrolase [Bacillus sp. S/N-304-OC-R1]MBY0121193.1 adenosylcobinamide amidohydrolase [Bacillus sp. S/N-304-OC-R1]